HREGKKLRAGHNAHRTTRCFVRKPGACLLPWPVQGGDRPIFFHAGFVQPPLWLQGTEQLCLSEAAFAMVCNQCRLHVRRPEMSQQEHRHSALASSRPTALLPES
ncbi:unnamed protein product, partial [Scytosiphon promiscuus]